MSPRLFVVFLLLLPGGVAAQTPAAPPHSELQADYARYREAEHRLGLEALATRQAQERLLASRAPLERFRQAHTREEVEQNAELRAELEELLVAEREARHAYEERTGRRKRHEYQTLRAEVEAAFKRLSQDLRQALQAEPDALDLRRIRAALLVDKGRFELASRDLQAVLGARPEDAEAHGLQGRCLEGLGRPEQALAHHRRALELDPSDARRIRAAVALYWLNRFAEADELRRQVEDPTALPAQLQLDLAWWLEDLDALSASWAREAQLRAAEAERDDLPRVALETSRGRIVLELFEDQAPNTVANIIELVRRGFYDGLSWHRVQPHFLAQTGDPATRPGAEDAQSHGPGYCVRDERGEGARRHFRGSVGLARGPQPDSGGSQLYLMLRPDPELDERFTVFGRVLEGMDIAAQLVQGDLLQRARVLRTRDHPYVPEKLPE